MARPKKLTPIAVAQIPCWVARGLSAAEIADKLGCTLGTLRVRCSQLGISLRRRPATEVGRAPVLRRGNRNRTPETEIHLEMVGLGVTPVDGDQRCAAATPWCAIEADGQAVENGNAKSRARLLVSLSHIAFDQLKHRATLKGVSGATLASMLLETIARDDLYTAVLDN